METEWTPKVIYKRVELINGRFADPVQLVMERLVDCRVEYRLPTEEEEADFVSECAW